MQLRCHASPPLLLTPEEYLSLLLIAEQYPMLPRHSYAISANIPVVPGSPEQGIGRGISEGADQVHGGARGGDADAGHVRDDVQVFWQARLAHEQVRAHPLPVKREPPFGVLYMLRHKNTAWYVQDDVQVLWQARLAHEQVRAHPLVIADSRPLVLSVLRHKGTSWSLQEAGHACMRAIPSRQDPAAAQATAGHAERPASSGAVMARKHT